MEIYIGGGVGVAVYRCRWVLIPMVVFMMGC